MLEVANIIKKNVRDSDIVGRYGGEKFMVISTGSFCHNQLGIKQFENQNHYESKHEK